MKLSVEKNELARALNRVQNAVENRTTIPILSNVLLRAESGKLTLSATDMDMSIVDSIDANIGVDGTLTTHARTLHDVVRKLSEGSQVSLEKDSATGQLRIHSGKSRFQLQTLDSDDFPVLSEGTFPHQFVMSNDTLKHLVDTTHFAISTEETRYYLNGIYFHLSDDSNKLITVATDGHRLAKTSVDAPKGSDKIPDVIIPRKAVGELRRLLEENNTDVEVSLSKTKIRLVFDNVILTSKLIDGKFPDYSRVIPTTNTQILQLDAPQFSSAVDRVSTIATDKVRAVKMVLDKNLVKLTASSTNNGEAEDEIECSYDGEPIEIGFNAKYLIEVTSQIGKNVIVFNLGDASAPALIYNQDDDSVLFVLMPMRV